MLMLLTSSQASVREGINIFLDGNIPSDMFISEAYLHQS